MRKKKTTFQKISDTGKVQKSVRKKHLHASRKEVHSPKKEKENLQKFSDTRKSAEVQASSTSWYREEKEILLEKVKKNKKKD